MMRRLLFFCFVVAVFCIGADFVVGEDDLSISTRVKPERLYVGQKAFFIVDVVSSKRTFVENPLVVDLFDDPSGVSFSRKVEGSFLKKRTIFTFVFFPEISGEQFIPGFSLMLKDAKSKVHNVLVPKTGFFVKTKLEKGRSYEPPTVTISGHDGSGGYQVKAPIDFPIKEIKTPFGIIPITKLIQSVFALGVIGVLLLILFVVRYFRNKFFVKAENLFESFYRNMDILEQELFNGDPYDVLNKVSGLLVSFLCRSLAISEQKHDAYGCIVYLQSTLIVPDQLKKQLILILKEMNMMRFSDKRKEKEKVADIIKRVKKNIKEFENHEI